MDHSRLLKFLVPGSDITEMAETPSFKFQFEYQNPNNVEAEVPGAQKLREAREGTANGNATLIEGDTVENRITDSAAGTDAGVSNENLEVASTDDFTLSPVITVTKKEAVFTKGDLKLQKITVTEDISENETHYSGSRTISYTEVCREVIKDGQVITTGYQVISNDKRNGESDKKLVEDSRSKTRIPKFKQTVEKVKAERRGSRDKKDQETHIPVRRSSIPKPSKESKIPPPSTKKEIIITKTEIKRQITEPDDEFDKIYEEIVVNTPTKVIIDDKTLYNKVDDPEKLETKFEEIIHDYDANKVEPINVEKVRRSKIPFLKRKSQQEMDTSQAIDRTSKIIAARDKIRLKSALSRPLDSSNDVKPDNEGKNQVVTHRYTKTVTTKQVSVDKDNSNEPLNDVKTTSTVINETFNIDTKSIENKADIITESKNNVVTEETNKNEVKTRIEIPVIIPVYNSYVKEHTETQEVEKTVKVKKTLEWTSTTGDFENKNEISDRNTQETKTSEVFEVKNEQQEPEVTTKVFEIKTETKTIENTPLVQKVILNVHKTDTDILTKQAEDNEVSEVSVKEKDSNIEEELAELRGKVSRLVNKIDLKEVSEIEAPKKDLNNDIPKKKTIMSKIAMFERLEPDEPFPRSRVGRSETKPPKLVIKDIQISTTEREHVHTPKIVEEVFKSFQGKTEFNTQDDKIDTDNNISKADIIVYDNKGKVENETKNIVLEESKICEEILTPVQGKLSNDMKHEHTSKFITETFDDQVKLPEHFKEEVVLHEKVKYANVIENTTKETHFTVQYVTTNKEIVNDITAVPNKVIEQKENTIETENIRPINLILSEFEINNNSIRDENTKAESDEVFTKKPKDFKYRDSYIKRPMTIFDDEDIRKAKSLAELDLGDAVKGKVSRMIFRMKSLEKFDFDRKEVISIKEMPRKRSVSEKIALFEGKLTPIKSKIVVLSRTEMEVKPIIEYDATAEEVYEEKVAELRNAKQKYGRVLDMPCLTLRTGASMPVLAVGTAMLDAPMAPHIIGAAIDLGYRAIDCAYIYGNEKVVGEAIQAKIADGTVTREELFIISKLWSTFHRRDLVETACRASLAAMGLEYFDLYLIHNPMSFKEGGAPIPKIATVLQYSEHDYLDAWYGMEELVSKGLAKTIGVSNFNSAQIQRVMDKGRIKPAVNQVECHPYLSQQRLEQFCTERNITLSCFGALGSKGTPLEYKSGLPPVIDDALVQVMASGLNVTAAQLLIRYQLECGRSVVVKSSSAAHLWDNLQALKFNLTSGQVDALHALNRNKRIFTFKGIGDTHKNYPFNIAF